MDGGYAPFASLFHNKQRECPKVLIPGQRHAARTMHCAIGLPDAAGCPAAIEPYITKKAPCHFWQRAFITRYHLRLSLCDSE